MWTIAVTTLLANDSDPEGSTLSVTGVGGAANGTVTLSEDEERGDVLARRQ